MFSLTPRTVAPGDSVTATGKAGRRLQSRIEVGPLGARVTVALFTTNPGGSYTVIFKAPTLPNGTYPVVLIQKRSDGVWRQADSGGDLIIKSVVVEPPPVEPPPPTTTGPIVTAGPTADPTQTTVQLTWSVDQFVTGQVAWGKTTSYGNLTPPELSYKYKTHIQSILGLDPDTEYFIKVFGHNDQNQPYEKVSTLRTKPPVQQQLPLAPTNLRATPGDAKVSLTWS